MAANSESNTNRPTLLYGVLEDDLVFFRPDASARVGEACRVLSESTNADVLDTLAAIHVDSAAVEQFLDREDEDDEALNPTTPFDENAFFTWIVDREERWPVREWSLDDPELVPASVRERFGIVATSDAAGNWFSPFARYPAAHETEIVAALRECGIFVERDDSALHYLT
jgi:hypothetical protein